MKKKYTSLTVDGFPWMGFFHSFGNQALPRAIVQAEGRGVSLFALRISSLSANS